MSICLQIDGPGAVDNHKTFETQLNSRQYEFKLPKPPKQKKKKKGAKEGEEGQEEGQEGEEKAKGEGEEKPADEGAGESILHCA